MELYKSIKSLTLFWPPLNDAFSRPWATAIRPSASSLSWVLMISWPGSIIGDFKPNLTVIFDIDPKKSHGNLTEMNRFENMGNEWLSKGLQGFRECAKFDEKRCVLMDSVGEIPEITKRIMKIINERLGL